MLVDSFGWIEYFDGTVRGRKARQRMDEADVVYTCPVVLAEVYSKIARSRGDAAARDHVAFILEHAAVVEHDADVGIEAGRIHAELKPRVKGFGMADALVLASARSRGSKVLTGDPHFRDVPDAEMI